MIQAVIFDLNGIFITSELLSARMERDFGVPALEIIAALHQIMPRVRKPKAPASFLLWNSYLQKWNLKMTEKEFWEYWFSGEKVDAKIARLCHSSID